VVADFLNSEETKASDKTGALQVHPGSVVAAVFG
jgi:hypothetical protein